MLNDNIIRFSSVTAGLSKRRKIFVSRLMKRVAEAELERVTHCYLEGDNMA